jgi:hypothetical protein
MTAERDELRSAIVARTEADGAVSKCETALRRARQMLIVAEGRLAEHVDLDARIARFHGARVAALAGDSDDDPEVPTELSPELASERAQRDQRREAIEAAKAAVTHLSATMAELQTSARRAAAKVAVAAERVVLVKLDEDAAEYFDLHAQVERLVGRLIGGSRVWTHGAGEVRPLSISMTIRSAVNHAEDQRVVGVRSPFIPHAQAATEAFSNWHQRLTKDADAELDPPAAPPPPAAAASLRGQKAA